jgi:hypothetical protein
MTPLIFLDTETTGLQPDRHTIWEIAWATALHDQVSEKLHLVRRRQATVPLPFDKWAGADAKALEIGRYGERGTDGLAEKETVIMWLQQDTANVQREAGGLVHLVGACPWFDHNMLAMNWLGWPGFGEGMWHYHLVDVEALAAGKTGIAPPYKSSELTDALGCKVDDKDKHTAMGDVNWAISLYAAVYKLEVVER